MLSNCDIVCFSTADWDTPLPTNQHHLMKRLGEANRVLYIETVGTRLPTAHPRDVQRLLRRFINGLKGARRAHERVWVLSPLVIPWFSSRAAIRVSCWLVEGRLWKCARQLGFDNPILWIYNPYAIHFIGRLPRSLLVYHCVDDLSIVPGAQSHALRKAETLLLENADLVFATSPALFEHCKRSNPSTYYQPNVADYSHFHRAAEESCPVAPPMVAIPKPRIVFAGNLAPHKINLDLIGFICRTRPDWNVILIGPQWEAMPAEEMRLLRTLPNLHFLGYVPYEDLPSHLKGADVLILPYRINGVMETVFPLKFFEFLATGKPVVSTPVPALKEFAEVVPMASSPEAFLKAIGESIGAKNSEEMQEKRMALARTNTWQHRLEEMSHYVDLKLGKEPVRH
jgi:glycosyltransferase involved in cell wall biosynthesis